MFQNQHMTWKFKWDFLVIFKHCEHSLGTWWYDAKLRYSPLLPSWLQLRKAAANEKPGGASFEKLKNLLQLHFLSQNGSISKLESASSPTTITITFTPTSSKVSRCTFLPKHIPTYFGKKLYQISVSHFTQARSHFFYKLNYLLMTLTFTAFT